MRDIKSPPRVVAPPADIAQWMRWVESSFWSTGLNTAPRTAMVAGDIGPASITAGSYAPGSLDGFLFTAAVLQSSDAAVALATGIGRWQADALGIHFYDSNGNNTINFDSDSGQALITGEFSTNLPGNYPRVSLRADPTIVYPTIDPPAPDRTESTDLGLKFETQLGDPIPFIGVTTTDTYASDSLIGRQSSFKMVNQDPTTLNYGMLEINPSSSSLKSYADDTGAAYPAKLELTNSPGQPTYAVMDGGNDNTHPYASVYCGASGTQAPGVAEVGSDISLIARKAGSGPQPSVGIYIGSGGNAAEQLYVDNTVVRIGKGYAGSVPLALPPVPGTNVEIANDLKVSGNLTVNGSFAGSVPTGAITAWSTTSSPNGWAICDGSSQLRAGTYSALFSIIGTTYGSVDSNHFNLPDLQSRVIVGVKSGTSDFSAPGATGLRTYATTDGSSPVVQSYISLPYIIKL